MCNVIDRRKYYVGQFAETLIKELSEKKTYPGRRSAIYKFHAEIDKKREQGSLIDSDVLDDCQALLDMALLDNSETRNDNNRHTCTYVGGGDDSCPLENAEFGEEVLIRYNRKKNEMLGDDPDTTARPGWADMCRSTDYGNLSVIICYTGFDRWYGTIKAKDQTHDTLTQIGFQEGIVEGKNLAADDFEDLLNQMRGANPRP